jgi:hypothetical protein
LLLFLKTDQIKNVWNCAALFLLKNETLKCSWQFEFSDFVNVSLKFDSADGEIENFNLGSIMEDTFLYSHNFSNIGVYNLSVQPIGLNVPIEKETIVVRGSNSRL